MKKFFALLFIILFVTPAYANVIYDNEYSSGRAFVQQVDLGKDNAGYKWWLIGYGPSQTGYYAVARSYYSTSNLKAETVNKLTGYYRIPYENASKVYFTEYRFEFTPDGNQYAEVSRIFYDDRGNEVCGYRTGHVVYNPVVRNTIQSKAAAYAMGRIR